MPLIITDPDGVVFTHAPIVTTGTEDAHALLTVIATEFAVRNAAPGTYWVSIVAQSGTEVGATRVVNSTEPLDEAGNLIAWWNDLQEWTKRERLAARQEIERFVLTARQDAERYELAQTIGQAPADDATSRPDYDRDPDGRMTLRAATAVARDPKWEPHTVHLAALERLADEVTALRYQRPRTLHLHTTHGEFVADVNVSEGRDGPTASIPYAVVDALVRASSEIGGGDFWATAARLTATANEHGAPTRHTRAAVLSALRDVAEIDHAAPADYDDGSIPEPPALDLAAGYRTLGPPPAGADRWATGSQEAAEADRLGALADSPEHDRTDRLIAAVRALDARLAAHTERSTEHADTMADAQQRLAVAVERIASACEDYDGSSVLSTLAHAIGRRS